MKTIIHVNGHNLRANKKNKNEDLPVFTVKDYRRNRKGNTVLILGPSMMVFKPHKKLKSGAVAWIQTNSPVEVVEKPTQNGSE